MDFLRVDGDDMVQSKGAQLVWLQTSLPGPIPPTLGSWGNRVVEHLVYRSEPYLGASDSTAVPSFVSLPFVLEQNIS